MSRRTTRLEDLTTMVLALWTLVGLLVDAYYHSTDPGLETFWTPWHALFYSGFTATAAWLGYLAVTRIGADATSMKPNGGPPNPVGRLLDSAPTGYRAALIGVAVFAIGGIGDAIWHTIFGIETSIDALLSPTHLLLFIGLVLIVSAPLRAAWADLDPAALAADDADGPAGFGREPTLLQFAAPLLSLLITTTVIGFFFQYAWAVTEIWMMRVPYDPNDGFSETIAGSSVLAVILTTAIMFTPLLVAAGRWRLPFGTATIVLTAVSTFIAAGFDEPTTGLPAVIVGGLLFDALVQTRANSRLLAAVPPLALWSAFYLLLDRSAGGLGLAPEIWGGSIVFAVLVMVVIDGLLRLGATLDVPRNTPIAASPAISSRLRHETPH